MNILEKVLLEVISGHIEKGKVTGKSPYGFTKGKSYVIYCPLKFILSLAELLHLKD